MAKKTLEKIPIEVSPNMKKETIYLNSKGQRIDHPKTKNVIGSAFEVDPPAPEGEQTGEAKPTNPLAKIIEAKVQEAVAKSLANIDIGAMVEKAVEDAFGGKE